MSDPTSEKALRDLWRNQPVENIAINLERLVNRRTEELDASTRFEILASLAAASLFVAFVSWRLAPELTAPLKLAIAATILWIAISAYRFRHRIWPKKGPGALASTGLEHYLNVLKRRREHLKSAWIWHGPITLAIAIFVLVLLRTSFPNPERLRNMLPFLMLLAVWIILGFWQRVARITELEREIRELELP
jgi:hypothetical protein